jgi:F0F1-type ATP synthase membrane subunit b/b'
MEYEKIKDYFWIIIWVVGLLFYVLLPQIEKSKKERQEKSKKELQKKSKIERQDVLKSKRREKMIESAIKLIPKTIIDLEPYARKSVEELPKKEKKYLESLKLNQFSSKQLEKKVFIEIVEKSKKLFVEKIINQSYEKLRYNDKCKSLFDETKVVSVINSSADIFSEILLNYLLRNYSSHTEGDLVGDWNRSHLVISKTKKWEE